MLVDVCHFSFTMTTIHTETYIFNGQSGRKPHKVHKLFNKHIITLDKDVDPQENEQFVMERLPNRDVLLRNIEK